MMNDFVAQFDFAWSWLGLGFALAMFGVLFLTDVFRSNTAKSRLWDGQWFAWLIAPMYMLHQFEEYALHYDWAKLSHPFANMICEKVGYLPYPDCPIPVQHYWLVNMSLWLFAMIGAKFYRKNPMVALAPFGLIFSNGLLHIVGWLVSGNSLLDSASGGTITSILLFIPVSVWLGFVLTKQKVMSVWAYGATLLAGTIGHLILFGAYASLDKGGVVALYTFDLLAIGSPLLWAWLLSRWFLANK